MTLKESKSMTKSTRRRRYPVGSHSPTGDLLWSGGRRIGSLHRLFTRLDSATKIAEIYWDHFGEDSQDARVTASDSWAWRITAEDGRQESGAVDYRPGHGFGNLSADPTDDEMRAAVANLALCCGLEVSADGTTTHLEIRHSDVRVDLDCEERHAYWQRRV